MNRSRSLAGIVLAAIAGAVWPSLGAAEGQASDIRNARMIYLGDSLTSNNGTLGPRRGYYHWTDVVQQRFNLQVVNLGKGGSHADGGLERLQAQLAEGGPKPDFVLVNFGMNDHKIAEENGQPVSSTAAFGQQLTAIVNLVRSVGAEPILVAPHAIYEGEPGGAYYYGKFSPANFAADGGALQRFDKFIAVIRNVSQQNNVPLIDLRKVSDEYDGKEYTLEGVHLSKLGHHIYGDTIGNFLAARYLGADYVPEPVASFKGGPLPYEQSFNALHEAALAAAELPTEGFPYHLAAAPFSGSSLAGWYVRNAAVGALAYRVYGETGTGSGYVNFGATGATNRALGGISNGSNALPQFGVVLRNDTGSVIGEVLISFAGEQWRGTGAAAALVFDYQVGPGPSLAAPGTFIEPGGNFNFTASGPNGSINGKAAGRVNNLGGILSGLNWGPGQYLILRWTNSTNAAGLAIDDFRIAGFVEPEPVVSFAGEGYEQTFDGLHDGGIALADLPGSGFPWHLAKRPFSNSLGMDGWYVRNVAPNALAYRVYGETGTGSGYINFGLTGAANRALGGISNGGSARPQFGVVLLNDTDSTITQIPISFAGEQWRGTGAEVTLVFDYQVGETASITAPGTFLQPGGNFNFAASGASGVINGKTIGRKAGLGGTLSGLNWTPGQYLILRWTNSTNTAGLAIDDFRIGDAEFDPDPDPTPTPIPGPSASPAPGPSEPIISFAGDYGQTFDGLHGATIALGDLPNSGFPYHLAGAPFTGSSGMGGWYVRNAAANALAYRVLSEAGSGSGYINFGPAGSANRALGGISNGSSARPQFGVVLRNDTASTITEIPVSFAGEQWRGTGAAVTLVFDYQVGMTPSIAASGTFFQPGGSFNFTASGPGGSLDGKTAGRVNNLGGVLSGLNWAPGQYLILRWTNSTDLAGLAIDDFHIGGGVPGPTPTPTPTATPTATPTPVPTPTPSPSPDPGPDFSAVSFGGHYSQNFDGLHSSSISATGLPVMGYPFFLGTSPFSNGRGLEGWYVRNAGTAALAYRVYGLAGDGSGFINFGRGPSGGGDRALGGLSNGGNARPGFGVVLKNVTGKVISEANMTYAGEQWRGTGQPAPLKFGYKVQQAPDTAAAALTEPGGSFDFTPSGPAGGIYGDTRGRTAGRGGTLQNLDWKPGEYLLLRWSNGQADAGLAIDDFTITTPAGAPAGEEQPAEDWIYTKFPYAYSLAQKRWFRIGGEAPPPGLAEGEFRPVPQDALDLSAVPPESVSPPYAAREVDPQTLLAWPSKPGAVSYNVYLSTGSTLDGGTFLGNRVQRWISPGTLAPGTRYYWRVDAVNAQGNVTPGNLWHFWTGKMPGTITLVDAMPNEPPNYLLRDWKEVARGFDRMVSDFDAEGEHLPIPFYTGPKRNFPHAFVNMPSFVGHDALTGALGTMSNVVGATLSGVDKSHDPLTGLDYVTMQSTYHSVDKGLGVLYHSPTAGPVQSGWYQLLAAVSHWQLVDLYPDLADDAPLLGNDGNLYTMEGIMRSNADKWREASQAMAGNYAHFAFNFETMQPDDDGTLLPHLAGPIAWLEYTAYRKYGTAGYLAAADDALGYLHGLDINPAHDLLLPYAGIAAARMNAEIGRNYDVGKFINWHFDNNGDVNDSTGVAGGEVWGGHSVAGLAGKPAYPIEKVYPANTFHSAGVLAPVARYDQRYARDMGKWLLNVAGNARFFYPNFLPPEKQETASVAWSRQYDPNGYIAYEFLGKDSYFINKPLADHSTPNGSVLAGNYASLMLEDQQYMVFKGASVASGPRLRHIWRFNLPSGWVHKIRLQGFISGTGAADGFRFAYSTSPNGPWTTIFTFHDTSPTERTMNFAEVVRPNISPVSGTVYIRVEDAGQLPAAGPDELHLDFLQVQTFDANTSPYLGGGHTAHGGTTDLCFYQSAQVGYFAGLVEPTNVQGVLQIDLLATDFLRDAAWPTYLYYNPRPNAVSVQVDVGPESADLYDTVTHQFLAQGVSGVRSISLPANSARVLVLAKAGGLRYFRGGKLYVDGRVVDHYSPAARAAADAPADTGVLDSALREALAQSPHGDTVPNLVKYALGLDPMAAATSEEREIVKVAWDSSGREEIRLRIPRQRDNVRYILHVSHDLESWSVLAEAEGRAPFHPAPGLGHPLSISRQGEKIILGGFDDDGAPSKFYRLEVRLR